MDIRPQRACGLERNPARGLKVDSRTHSSPPPPAPAQGPRPAVVALTLPSTGSHGWAFADYGAFKCVFSAVPVRGIVAAKPVALDVVR